MDILVTTCYFSFGHLPSSDTQRLGKVYIMKIFVSVFGHLYLLLAGIPNISEVDYLLYDYHDVTVSGLQMTMWLLLHFPWLADMVFQSGRCTCNCWTGC